MSSVPVPTPPVSAGAETGASTKSLATRAKSDEKQDDRRSRPPPKLNAFWDWDFPEKHAYITESHKQFRRKIRAFVEEHMTPFVDEWEEKKAYPTTKVDGPEKSLNKIAANAGIYGAIWAPEIGGTKQADFDVFHDMIFWDELERCGSNGTVVGCFFTTSIALPPVVEHGLAGGPESPKTIEVCRSILQGDKVIALAVSEPTAGSDVANLQRVV